MVEAAAELVVKAAVHDRQLEDIRDGHFLEVQRRSALGLTWVYNHLPAEIVEASSVSDFQRLLQELVKVRARERCEDWRETLSPRLPVHCHPLR